MKDCKISYIFPCRDRFEKFFATLNNIRELSESDNYEVICPLDENDPILNNEYVKIKLRSYKNVTAYYGESEGKISACNREAFRATGQIMCLQSDDMVWTEKGFDNIIREAAKGYSGLIHFPDQRLNEQLITYPIMTRDYFDMFGYFYHKDYLSVYADMEQMEVAKELGKYKYVDRNIIRHEHYRGGYGEPDSLMKHNERAEFYLHDREVYNQRKLINFGLSKITA